MADDRIAEMIAQSNAALAATLAGALQGLRSPHIPSFKLSRFMGHPTRGGDPTVAEWLQEFDVYARQTGVKDVDRAVALLDHLGGFAREEVLCQPERVRQDCKALVALLLLRFGAPETVPSLSTAFHGRMQLDSERLAARSVGSKWRVAGFSGLAPWMAESVWEGWCTVPAVERLCPWSHLSVVSSGCIASHCLAGSSRPVGSPRSW